MGGHVFEIPYTSLGQESDTESCIAILCPQIMMFTVNSCNSVVKIVCDVTSSHNGICLLWNL